jgi:hypothetical protein
VSAEPSHGVALDVVFERFPASVRGAIRLRGLDGDPHQVRVAEARAVEAGDPSRRAVSIALDPVTVDVVPRGDVVVPFDVPFASLEPGWYRIEASGLVDGQHDVHGPPDERRFLVPWPSEEVRRGEVRVGGRLQVGGARVRVDRVEGKADRAIVRWHTDPAAEVQLRILVARHRLPILDPAPAGTAERATVTYPILRRFDALKFELDASRPGKVKRSAISVDLP